MSSTAQLRLRQWTFIVHVKHTLAGHNHASSSSRVSWLLAHPIRLCSPWSWLLI